MTALQRTEFRNLQLTACSARPRPKNHPRPDLYSEAKKTFDLTPTLVEKKYLKTIIYCYQCSAGIGGRLFLRSQIVILKRGKVKKDWSQIVTGSHCDRNGFNTAGVRYSAVTEREM
jgi:hypothetical protein